jgi:hypothetical protein
LWPVAERWKGFGDSTTEQGERRYFFPGKINPFLFFLNGYYVDLHLMLHVLRLCQPEQGISGKRPVNRLEDVEES